MDWDSLGDPSFGEPERLPGQGKPVYRAYGDGRFDVEDFIQVTYQNIWNRRMLGAVRDAYIPQMRFHGSTNRTYYGRGQFQAYILSMMAMFPELALQIEDIYWMGNDDDGYLTAVRWRISGTHRGNGIYGAPTGRPINMWGISQHRIIDGKIHEEWTLFNEFAVMQQIYRD
ncbi:ester cyclase [Candidatus Leptofilum sp.]|uniref:ester cyclase n=1 Tax=Candidatus Leptofilum sp. TaxID=3241576 RepID=UPI003B59D522